MNPYEAKQEERRERLLERAAQKAAEATARHAAYRRTADMIPLGQPILVGHHSEKRHRRDLARMEQNVRASVEARQEAEDLRRRAAAVGTAGVSSDDPEAVAKLREKLAALERTRTWYKRVGAVYRKAGLEGLQALLPDLTEEERASLLRLLRGASLDPLNRGPVPGYLLSNLGAEIRRTQQRIESLAERASQTTQETRYTLDGVGEVRVVENVEENRLQIRFPAIPPEALRARLKQAGFRWSPTQGAWQRHLNPSAKAAAQYVLNVT
jgi:hypothetical protein